MGLPENVYLVCREEHLPLIAVECDTFNDTVMAPSGDLIVEAVLRRDDSHAHLVTAGVGLYTHGEILAFLDNTEKPKKRRQTHAE